MFYVTVGEALDVKPVPNITRVTSLEMEFNFKLICRYRLGLLARELAHNNPSSCLFFDWFNVFKGWSLSIAYSCSTQSIAKIESIVLFCWARSSNLTKTPCFYYGVEICWPCSTNQSDDDTGVLKLVQNRNTIRVDKCTACTALRLDPNLKAVQPVHLATRIVFRFCTRKSSSLLTRKVCNSQWNRMLLPRTWELSTLLDKEEECASVSFVQKGRQISRPQ